MVLCDVKVPASDGPGYAAALDLFAGESAVLKYA
jgi:hypothetical protein